MKKLITLILCVAAITYSTGALASDTLMAGNSLAPGQWLVSRNGIYVLIMQHDDGNLVLYYHGGGRAFIGGFSTNQAGANAYAHMQADGNFVVYRSNQTPFWASNTGGRPYNPSYQLKLTDAGSLVIHDGAGNVIKTLFRDDYYCTTGGRLQALYPVCHRTNNTTFNVITTCGLTAEYKAYEAGATLGACY